VIAPATRIQLGFIVDRRPGRDFCGKNRHKAHKVSHSNIKTRKWQQPNLQSIRAVIDGQVRRVSACTRCIRSGKVVKAA
jgi:large subunit ribosomal protein L28